MPAREGGLGRWDRRVWRSWANKKPLARILLCPPDATEDFWKKARGRRIRFRRRAGRVARCRAGHLRAAEGLDRIGRGTRKIFLYCAEVRPISKWGRKCQGLGQNPGRRVLLRP